MKSLRDRRLFEAPWGISAVGSASHWQCGGQGFKSPMLHQKKYGTLLCFVLFLFFEEHRGLEGRGTENSTVRCSTEPPLRPQAGKSPMLHQKSTEHFCVPYFFYFSKSIGGLSGQGTENSTVCCSTEPPLRPQAGKSHTLFSSVRHVRVLPLRGDTRSTARGICFASLRRTK